MKKMLSLVLPFIILASCGIKEEYKYAGTKTPYCYHEVSYVAPPEGYYPFYIDYTGRHGSRYMGDPTEKTIAEILQKAQVAGQLKDSGSTLLERAGYFTIVNEGSYGLLTAIGKQELEEIGQRISSLYPEIFKGNTLKVLTTEKERTKQSAQAFLSSYVNIYDTIAIEQELATAQTTLRFFEYSDEYNSYRKGGYVAAVVDSIRNSEENERHTKYVLERIFKKEFIEELDKGIVTSDDNVFDSKRFALSLYDLYTASLSLPSGVVNKYSLDFAQYFTEEEKKWFDKAISCRSYMTIGPAFNANGIQVKVASPLLISILKTADSVVNGKRLDAYLKFGHAETTTPLATLMEIEGANRSASSIMHFDSYWNAESIAPMAANIQLVFYKNEDADKPILVKVLLNEIEAKIPIQSGLYPYYAWKDVRRYYLDKLHKLGVDIDMQPLELLRHLDK